MRAFRCEKGGAELSGRLKDSAPQPGDFGGLGGSPGLMLCRCLTSGGLELLVLSGQPTGDVRIIERDRLVIFGAGARPAEIERALDEIAKLNWALKKEIEPVVQARFANEVAW